MFSQSFAWRCALFAGVGLGWLTSCLQGQDRASQVKSRSFYFTYAGTIKGMPPGQKARVWLPVPPTNEDQMVKLADQQLPSKERLGQEAKYGNQILYFEAPADAEGQVRFSVRYHVVRFEVKADQSTKGKALDDLDVFLKADAKVPIGGKPLTLLDGKALPGDQMDLARLFYDVVNQHMRYSKEGTGWGQGDAEWACDSRFGNCSDFHSLFISLSRSFKIPAKFEMGFPLPEKRGEGDIPGYHCWAKFKPQGRGWIPVDISEANKDPKMKEYYFGNLTEDRVAFTVGRDLTLNPPQSGPALNFFIYPYVEVEGQPWPGDKIDKRFSFADAPPSK